MIHKSYRVFKMMLALVFLCKITISSFGQPQGFIDQEFVGGWNQAVGMTFDNNGRMFVWEKGGRVYVVENGSKLPDPLIDLSQEVGNWRDFGLLGFALDPDFLSNGYIYLLYIVDRHHLLHFGTAAYDPDANEYFNATIGRLTRYKALSATNFTTVDYDSRTVLLGATKETGFPSLHDSHGVGSLVFGNDGTLMVTLGDGASYGSLDQGSASETFYQQALMDGIITPDQNVGAYRAQMIQSLNGKILRIDPQTGEGIPSNPYYQSHDPQSVASKVWSVGIRNAYRMTKRPDTGSHFPEDGDPGVFYFGDVGWSKREELNVVKGPGDNFGWPKYEGMNYLPGYNNSQFKPQNHTMAAVEWRRGKATPKGSIDGQIYDIGSQEIPGPTFKGNCSTGGVWYTGDDFPEEYKNSYFHADYGAHWIQNFRFDENNNIQEIKSFDAENGSVVFLATHPISGGLYYIRYGSAIHKISHQPSGNQPPVAIASADKLFGTGPLAVQFTGDQSSDPEQSMLSYQWDFGNGPESTDPNPNYTFNAPLGVPTTYDVRLTVMDQDGLIDETTISISVNNTPPVITATSLDQLEQYSLLNQTTLDLSALVTDDEHAENELSYEWQTALYHDNHNHPENIDNNPVTTTVISPVGCDGTFYFYKITLKVTDAAGLSAYYEKDIYPDCGGPVAINDSAIFPGLGMSTVIDVLANDDVSIDPTTVTIGSTPSFGSLSVDPSTGNITYTRTSPGSNDSFTYHAADFAGSPSNLAGVSIDQLGDPTLAILNPENSSNLGSSEVTVFYEISGAWQGQGADTILVSLDSQPPYEVEVNQGVLQLSGVALGIHQLTLQLSVNGTPLITPGATSSIMFNRIAVGGGNGLSAEYFNNTALNEPATLTRIDPMVDFNWGVNAPDLLLANDNFSVRWSGQVQAVYDEVYTFYTNTDDGVRLYIDGELLIDQWVDQAPTEYAASVLLESGVKYSLEMEYYEREEGAKAQLSWSSLSQAKELIPSSQLFTLLDQTISFDPIGDKLTTDDAFNITATASSGLPVSFSIVSGPAAITGSTVSLTGTPGEVLVAANQEGDQNYSAASMVQRSFEVIVADPPKVKILYPEESDMIDGVSIEVSYQLSGDLSGVGYLQLQLDDDPFILVDNLIGPYTMHDINPGTHRLQARLMSGAQLPLENPEAFDEIMFENYILTSIPGDGNGDPEGMVKVYPNPMMSIMIIRFNIPEQRAVVINLFDVLGQKISIGEQTVRKGISELKIDKEISGLPSGPYFLQIASNNQQPIMIKLIKN